MEKSVSWLLGLLVVSFLWACGEKEARLDSLREVERWLEERPDSALALLKQWGEPEEWPAGEQALAWFWWGKTYQALGRPLAALRAFQMATRAKSELPIAYIAEGEWAIGELLGEMGLHEEAVIVRKRAVDRFERLADKRRLARAYGAIATDYTLLNQIDSALVYLIRMDSLVGKTGDEALRMALVARENLAFISREASKGVDEVVRAMRYVDQVFMGEADGELPAGERDLRLGCLFLYAHRLDSAGIYLARAARRGDEGVRANALFFQEKLNRRWGDLNASYHLYRSNTVRRDSLARTDLIIHGLYEPIYRDYQALSERADREAHGRESNHFAFLALLVIAVVSLLGLAEVCRRNRKALRVALRWAWANHLPEEGPDHADRQALIDDFRNSELYRRFEDMEWRPTERDWHELLEAIDATYDRFATRFAQLSARLNEKEIRTACLIKIGFPPSLIAHRLICTKTNVAMIRARVYEKIFGEKGSSERCDAFIRSF